MHVAITGSRGLVGSKTDRLLTARGHKTTRMARDRAGDGEVSWDPAASSFDASELEGVDAVVHLAGENIASRRWNARQKQRIRDSRVQGTRVLCEGLAGMRKPPKVLVAASAIGFYGDRGGEMLSEDSSPGNGFLADVCQQWEAATRPAEKARIRVVNLRIGVVFSSEGGALAKMLLPFKLGFGGVVGSGQQYWSWIALDDLACAIKHALTADTLSGPVNAVSPNAVTNREFTRTLGRVLSRPTIVPIPAFLAKLAMGEMANELLLSSTRVVPNRLQESGYEFQHATLENALRHALGQVL